MDCQRAKEADAAPVGGKVGADELAADLVEATAGRIKAAIDRGQNHFDDMERSHQVILAGVLVAILYHRESHEERYRERANKLLHQTALCVVGEFHRWAEYFHYSALPFCRFLALKEITAYKATTDRAKWNRFAR